MKPITLIADSGSSKTSWALLSADNTMYITTRGLNPVRDNAEVIRKVLTEELVPQLHEYKTITAIYFYGAGCISPFKETLSEQLNTILHPDTMLVDSDLLGAARALCGHVAGIACILGTGSNSCYYDGEQIVENVSPLGYILGDEGSGAVLGKTLVGDLLKGQLSPELREEFLQRFSLTPAEIINRVYRQPLPNKFLASLVPFLGEHRNDEGIHRLLVEQFRRFFHRNVALYHHPELPINFVGGVAGSYRDEIEEAARLEGFTVGRILQKPIEAMVQYHQKG